MGWKTYEWNKKYPGLIHGRKVYVCGFIIRQKSLTKFCDQANYNDKIKDTVKYIFHFFLYTDL